MIMWPLVKLDTNITILASYIDMSRLSGVQREVTQLYRRVLRAAKLKDGGAGTTTKLVRAEFREQVTDSQ